MSAEKTGAKRRANRSSLGARIFCAETKPIGCPSFPALASLATMPRGLGVESYDEEDIIDCEECDAGASCGMCLVLVLQDKCPTDIDAFQHMIDADGLAVRTRCLDVNRGEVCEGSGECGTDDGADNCLTSDIYRHVECYGDFLLDPQSNSHPSPPPPLPTPRTPSPQTAAFISSGRASGSTPIIAPVGPAASPTAGNSSLIVACVAGALLLVALVVARKRLFHAWWVQRQGAAATNLISGGALSASFAPGGVEASCELGVLPPLERDDLERDDVEIIGKTRVLPVDPLADSRM